MAAREIKALRAEIARLQEIVDSVAREGRG